MDHFGLVQPVDGLGQRVVVGIADAAEGGFDAGIAQPLGVADRHVLHAAIRVVNQLAIPSPRVQRLRSEHPSLKIELVPTNRVQDLLQREADIAIRMTPPQQQALIARRIGNIELGLFAHADYLARHGTPDTPASLKKHVLIGFDRETPFLRAAKAKFPFWSKENFALCSDSDVAQLAMIRAGCGIGICQVALAKRGDNLIRVLPDALSFPLETWVMMRGDLRGSRRCKTVFDALVTCMEAHIKLSRTASKSGGLG